MPVFDFSLGKDDLHYSRGGAPSWKGGCDGAEVSVHPFSLRSAPCARLQPSSEWFQQPDCAGLQIFPLAVNVSLSFTTPPFFFSRMPRRPNYATPNAQARAVPAGRVRSMERVFNR